MNRKITSKMLADLLNIKSESGSLSQRLKRDLKHNNKNLQVVLINDDISDGVGYDGVGYDGESYDGESYDGKRYDGESDSNPMSLSDGVYDLGSNDGVLSESMPILINQQKELINQQKELINQQQEQLNLCKRESGMTSSSSSSTSPFIHSSIFAPTSKKHKKTVRFNLLPKNKNRFMTHRRMPLRATPRPIIKPISSNILKI